MNSRRQFLTATASALLASPITRANPKKFPYAEFEQRIARKNFNGMTKDTLPTPCMVVDIDLFEKNLKTMADYAKTAPILLRPHVKVHKSVDIAKRQMALGAPAHAPLRRPREIWKNPRKDAAAGYWIWLLIDLSDQLGSGRIHLKRTIEYFNRATRQIVVKNFPLSPYCLVARFVL